MLNSVKLLKCFEL